MVACEVCGGVPDPEFKGWRGDLVVADENVPDGGETTGVVVFYCGDCWNREFRSDDEDAA